MDAAREIARRRAAERQAPAQEDYPEPGPSAASLRCQRRNTRTHPQEQAYERGRQETEQQADPSRYDDALYGQLENGAHDFQREAAYPDDPYAYQDGYEDEPEDPPKRRGGLMTVAAVLALAVIGTGAAFAYRTYVGCPQQRRSADHQGRQHADQGRCRRRRIASGKTPDRMPAGDGSEKIVPREETPVDVNAATAPARGVPAAEPECQSAAAGERGAAATAAAAAVPTNGTMPNSEPRKIRTLSVRGDQADAGRSCSGARCSCQPPSRRSPLPAAPRKRRRRPPQRQCAAVAGPGCAGLAASGALSRVASRPCNRRRQPPAPAPCRERGPIPGLDHLAAERG